MNGYILSYWAALRLGSNWVVEMGGGGRPADSGQVGLTSTAMWL